MEVRGGAELLDAAVGRLAHVVFEQGDTVTLNSKGQRSREDAAEKRRNMDENSKVRPTLCSIRMMFSYAYCLLVTEIGIVEWANGLFNSIIRIRVGTKRLFSDFAFHPGAMEFNVDLVNDSTSLH